MSFSMWLVCCSCGFVFVAALMVFLVLLEGIKKKRKLEANRELALWRARCCGCIMYVNEVGGVIGVCSAYDWRETFQNYLKSVEKGEHKNWERIQLRVNPTFTFYAEKRFQNLIQVGNKDQLVKLVVGIVEKVIGFNLCELTGMYVEKISDYAKIPGKIKEELEEIWKILIVKNEQLFVPFATAKPSKEEQEFYGEQHRFLQACERLGKDLPFILS